MPLADGGVPPPRASRRDKVGEAVPGGSVGIWPRTFREFHLKPYHARIGSDQRTGTPVEVADAPLNCKAGTSVAEVCVMRAETNLADLALLPVELGGSLVVGGDEGVIASRTWPGEV